ncbi:MAG: sodium/proline symporter [Verrucomicrobia bacterium]|nr:sodium/proline symporter [Verrucomicrobiota bacterium]
MHSAELLAIFIYFGLLLTVAFFSYRKHLSASDFIIGSRSMNYWLTALAAHASDMSSWMFLAYPAAIFGLGIFGAWAAVGLIGFMLLNWQLVAPKIRVATERYGSMTFSTFFESRLGDTSGMIRVFTALMSLLFFTIYISSGLVGIGEVLHTLFGVAYTTGISLGILIVIPYVFIGGYRTLAWIDLFQGLFLMGVILFVPLYILPQVGGWEAISTASHAKGLTFSLFPDFSSKTLLEILALAAGWGLGYFGQPQIVTKFMGIRDVHEISKSKWIGMSWMTLSLSAATLVGLVAIPYFQGGIANPELAFIEMVQNTFPPFVVGLMLCGVLATTINAMSSQVLVLSSSIAEDFYKRLFRKRASSRELLFVARGGVLVAALVAFGIAYAKISSIYSLVLYAWSGLGASFGPLMLLCLYSKKINKYGAWAGILSGGLTSALWPYFGWSSLPPLIPGFIISFLLILIISTLTKRKS